MIPIVLQVPEELKSVAAPIEALLCLTSTAHESARAGRPMQTATFEREVAAHTAAIERAVHQPILAACDPGVPYARINGVLHRRLAPQPTTFFTLAGPVLVARALYRPCEGPAGPHVDPVALRVGALDRWLPHTAAMAFLVQQNTSREAQQTARELGRLPYERNSFERLAHRVGARYGQSHEPIEQALIEAYEVPAAARSLSVSIDRVSVRMEEPHARGPGRPRVWL